MKKKNIFEVVPDGRWPQAPGSKEYKPSRGRNSKCSPQRHVTGDDQRDIAKQEAQEERGDGGLREKIKTEASDPRRWRVLEWKDMEYKIGVLDIFK